MVRWEVAEALGIKPEISRERIEVITASGREIVPLINLPCNDREQKSKKCKSNSARPSTQKLCRWFAWPKFSEEF